MRGVQGAASMPVANLRQILFVFSAGSHEELMKLSVMLLSSGREEESEHGKKEKKKKKKKHLSLPVCTAPAIYESHPLAPATGPCSCTHLWSLW